MRKGKELKDIESLQKCNVKNTYGIDETTSKLLIKGDDRMEKWLVSLFYIHVYWEHGEVPKECRKLVLCHCKKGKGNTRLPTKDGSV